MNLELVEKIAAAVLYEGYLLYPYRQSAVKNQRRFNFGVLVPQSYGETQPPQSEHWRMQTECLVAGGAEAEVDIKARFLHLRERLRDAESGRSWQEAVEREINLPGLSLGRLAAAPYREVISFRAAMEPESGQDTDEDLSGAIVSRQEAIEGAIKASATLVGEQLYRVTVQIFNLTQLPDAAAMIREQALMHSLVSAHTILAVRGGEFISLLDPSHEFREAAAGCRNIGTWPVLAGVAGDRDQMLSSPIILYDYPQIAPESAGDLFDGTEIDEILLLRILTLTDEEKRELREGDERARRILERAENLPPEQMMKLHGVLRSPRLLDG